MALKRLTTNRISPATLAVFSLVGALSFSGFAQSQVGQDASNPRNESKAVEATQAAPPIDVGRVVPIPLGADFPPHLITRSNVEDSSAGTARPTPLGSVRSPDGKNLPGRGAPLAPVGTSAVASGDDCCSPDETNLSRKAGGVGSVVYSNRLGTRLFFPGGVPGALVSDDIATTASGGCVLESLRFRVSGDPLGDGSGAGPFSVTFALYNACPSAGGEPIFEPLTVNFEDNGNHEVVFEPEAGTIIEVPTNAYFGVQFSRSLAGIVAGAPATLGFSADRFNFPGFCDATFGGFPGFDHGSFDLEITARNDCPGGVCSSTCVGGDNDGEFCFRDDCPSGMCAQDIACLGGLNNGLACTSDTDCPDMCSGGSNNGNQCNSAFDCPSECRSGFNVGSPCDDDADCPESTCSIGSCPDATCTGDRCVGGSNDSGLCLIDDCPSGSCSGAKLCDGGINADQACVFDCVASFPAYKNSGQGGSLFGKPPQSQFAAEDIRLGIPVDENNPCNLISWEVGIKGGGILNAGAVQAELHIFIDDADPENGGRIPGTRMSDIISGFPVKFLKKTFAAPIPLTQRDLFVVFKIQNNFVGPIITCEEAGPGSTENLVFVHDGNSWNDQIFDTPGVNCFAGFEVTLSCEGSPPSGACCDMALTENRTCIGGSRDGLVCDRDSQCRVCIGGDRPGFVCDQDTDCPGGACPGAFEQFCVGDAVCRELPEMNCAFPTRWVQGSHCGPVCQGGDNDGEPCAVPADCPGGGCEGSFCEGGVNDGAPCSRQADCDGGDCVGQPFDYGVACGVAACCTVDMGCLDVTEAECHEFDGPVQFRRGVPLCGIGGSRCPIGPCLTRVGECTIPRPGEVGCESPTCCRQVCEFDPFCCEVEWDETCVRWENDFSACQRTVANNRCEDAIMLDVGDSIVVAGSGASGGADEPGFCCFEPEFPGDPGPGSRAAATVWYTFVATETSARISTCDSAAPIEDTLVQVFSVAEFDSGLCADQSVCSVLANDCVDQSPCVRNNVAACGSLSPIACNDNGSGCGDGRLADVCVTGLVPGTTYYVMVGGKFFGDRGLFDVAIEAPCTLDVDPLPNDLCDSAVRLDESNADCQSGHCSVLFDLSGGGVSAPATFDCPGPNCLNTMENDVWFDWIAPGTGFVSVETCDPLGGEETPDTSLVVYEGCDCPVEFASEVGCSETELTADCFLGSRTTVPVQGGECYKIRLGGNLIATPTGTLTIQFTGCPPGPVTFVDPPPGTVDARQPHPPSEPNVAQGIDSFVVSWPGGTTDPFCRAFCETSVEGSPSNLIFTMTDNGGDTFTVNLARPLAPGAAATITFLHGDGTNSSATIASHPGNVDGSATASLADITALVSALNGDISINVYSHDIDRSGTVTPQDVLRLIDLLTGAGGAFAHWLDSGLPPCGDCCPP